MPELRPLTTYVAMPGLATWIVCVSALGDEPYWMRKPARLLSVEPSVFCVGDVHDSVALPFPAAAVRGDGD